MKLNGTFSFSKTDLFGESEFNANNNNLSLFVGLSAEEDLDEVLLSTKDQSIDLTDEFKENYERWLEREVYGNNIDWDQLLVRMDESSDFD